VCVCVWKKQHRSKPGSTCQHTAQVRRARGQGARGGVCGKGWPLREIGAKGSEQWQGSEMKGFTYKGGDERMMGDKGCLHD
jgi:hypothetical protein